MLLHPRKVVCSGLFTFGFPSVLSLVPPCASTVLRLSLPLSLSFQTDDREIWMQCVRYSSWINAFNSVCLHPSMLGVLPCAALQQLWGRGLWFQHLLTPPLIPQLVGVGLCHQFGGTALSPCPRLRRCTERWCCDCCCHGGGGSSTVLLSPEVVPTAGRKRGQSGESWS